MDDENKANTIATPIGDRVLMQMREVGVTDGGIVLPQAQGVLVTEGKVLAVGPGVCEIEVGDWIIIPPTGVAYGILVDKKEYVVIREEDVLVNLGPDKY